MYLRNPPARARARRGLNLPEAVLALLLLIFAALVPILGGDVACPLAGALGLCPEGCSATGGTCEACEPDATVAIGDVRTVILAEATYQSANLGYYGSLECLGTPSDCIPGYPVGAPVFLSADLAQPAPYVKDGYERHFHGTPAGVVPPVADPGSLIAFAYYALPTCGALPAYCGQADGFVGTTDDLAAAEASLGQSSCDPSVWTALE